MSNNPVVTPQNRPKVIEEAAMRSALKKLWRDDSGQGLTEYALLIALVSLGLILLLGAYRNALGNVFRNASNALNNNSTVIQATP